MATTPPKKAVPIVPVAPSKPVGNFEPTELDNDDVEEDNPANYLATEIQELDDPKKFIDDLNNEAVKQAQTGSEVRAIGSVFGVIRKILFPALPI